MENCLRQHLHQALSELETIGGTGGTKMERQLDVIMSVVGVKEHDTTTTTATTTSTSITPLTEEDALVAANNLVAATV